MKRGPKPGQTIDAIAVVREAWVEAPDWVIALAEACNARGGQAAAAKAIDYSAAVVNQALKGVYKGDVTAVESRVRAAFMSAERHCPELGRMPAHACFDWQKKARTFANVNPLRVRMYRACRKCPLSRFQGRFQGAAS